ncbi:MAG: FadR/GntR family transcriptional regulator [Bacteroidota bacterium]
MADRNLLANFQEIAIQNPVDMIIKQVRGLITSGQLAPGDRLPPERKLAEKLGVSRSHVREALRKLEFYGILRTLPQSGTIVAGIGISALEGLISDVLKLDQNDFASLVETRVLLEKQAAYLAAERRTEADIETIRQAMEAYEQKVQTGDSAVEEDLMFHLKIAQASKNTVLKSLMLIITPDIISSFNVLRVCEAGGFEKAIGEHRVVYQHIVNQEPQKSADAMAAHLQEVLDFSKDMRS